MTAVSRAHKEWPMLRPKVSLLALVVQLFWLVPAMALVVLFAVHPLTAVVSLTLGLLTGFILGAYQRIALAFGTVGAVFIGGLLANGWQSAGGDSSAAALGALQLWLDILGPAMLGVALGFITGPIAEHIRRPYSDVRTLRQPEAEDRPHPQAKDLDQTRRASLPEHADSQRRASSSQASDIARPSNRRDGGADS